MTRDQFLSKYQKVPVIEYPNQVKEDECLLTVRLTAYNHAHFIRECLDSILCQQTNFNFQVLILEDASSDETRDICKEYAERYPEKVRLLLNDRANNIKIAERPSGLFSVIYSYLLIKTKYISIIEADDFWTDKSTLQKKVEILENNSSCTFCFSDGVRFDDTNQEVLSSSMVKLNVSGIVPKARIMSLTIPTASLVFRNIIEDIFHDEIFQIPHGDILLRSKLSHYGNGYFVRELKPIYRRVHDQGIYSSLELKEKFKMIIETRKSILVYFKRKNWESEFLLDNLCHIYLKKIKVGLKKFEFDFSAWKELNIHAKNSSHSVWLHIWLFIIELRKKS
ncbi:glycosyltransferase [Roseivirga sp.]|uniref:glycosyltransferase n=1 Tax=Roseivirga sp. TaxID=1964215 RepID=UPI003B8CE049